MTRYVISFFVCSWLLYACSHSGKKSDTGQPAVTGEVFQQYYQCLPCGYDCDTLSFDQPGTCPHCRMERVKKESIRHGNLSIAALCLETRQDLVFLDVRTEEEFSGRAAEKFGAIKGAINIPVQELEKRIKELDPYKGKKIIVYCSHSHRSPMASYLLTQNGFTQIYNLEGGMSVWKEQVNNPDCNQIFYQNQQ